MMHEMKRSFFHTLIGIMLVACHTPAKLPPGRWEPAVREALDALIREADGYAVFDFDKTTIAGDISQALWVYQLEHLRYADAPAHAFLDGIPDINRSAAGITFADMGKALQEEYRQMISWRDNGATLEEIRCTALYQDFRARMYSLMMNIDEVFGHDVSYLWMPGLLAGFTEAEAREVVREAIADQLGAHKLDVQEWRSPDGRWGGQVERGVCVSQEMKDLFHCLEAAGIDVYICSASMELIVEELARELEVPTERVFGLRFVPAERVTAVYDSTYIQPIKQGKVTCIQTFIAPSHGGRGPVLVGGDSNGDVAMLTAFPDTRHGLVIDVGRRKESAIGQLAEQAKAENNKGRYLLQPAFALPPVVPEGGGI